MLHLPSVLLVCVTCCPAGAGPARALAAAGGVRAAAADLQ